MSSADELRKKYLRNPPEGSSKEEIEQMDDEDLQTMETVKVKCSICKHTELVPKKALDNLVLDYPNTEVSIPCPYCFASMIPTNYTNPNGKKDQS